MPQLHPIVRALAAGAVLAYSALPALAADPACGLDAQSLQQFQKVQQDVVTRGFAPGIVTSLYCDGKPVHGAAFGKADRERDQPMTEQHLFRIYSMSKPVTSLAIMMLSEDGALKLDDPVSRFLPEFSQVQIHDGADGKANRAPGRAITVRDLLRHTAGIPYRGEANPVEKLYVLRGIDHGGGAVVTPQDGSAPVDTLAELVRRIGTTPVLDEPGERFRYGNSTDVLGRIVEVASRQPLADFLARRIFEPLGMSHTSFVAQAKAANPLTAAYWGKSAAPADARILKQTDTRSLQSTGLSLAEDPGKSIFARPRAITFGGAGLVSTAADYQRFLQLFLSGGTVNGRRIVGADTVAQMTANQLAPTALSSPALAAQGLGFGLGFATVLDPARAPAPVSKGTFFWGGAASTYFWVDPKRKLSGVVMTQVFGGDVGAFYIDMLKALYSRDAAN